jgi:dTDP-4-dehydrorhamnose 3,5-epimerase
MLRRYGSICYALPSRPVKVERARSPMYWLRTKVFGDARGFSMKLQPPGLRAGDRRRRGIRPDNHSRSAKNVLRGLHYQLRQPQGKLIRVTAGEIWDVAVDLRRGSPDFGRWTGMALDLELRLRTRGRRGLPHLFRRLWDRFGRQERPITEADVPSTNTLAVERSALHPAARPARGEGCSATRIGAASRSRRPRPR